jgi:hypothetical protein
VKFYPRTFSELTGRALTKEDEKAISEFRHALKHKKAKSKTRLSSRKNAKETVNVKV